MYSPPSRDAELRASLVEVERHVHSCWGCLWGLDPRACAAGDGFCEVSSRNRRGLRWQGFNNVGFDAFGPVLYFSGARNIVVLLSNEIQAIHKKENYFSEKHDGCDVRLTMALSVASLSQAGQPCWAQCSH